MKLVQIDPVRIQPVEAGLAGLDDVPPAVSHPVGVIGHPAVDLRAKDDSVAVLVALQGIAYGLLAVTRVVDIRGVEKVDPCVNGAIDDLA